MHRDEYYIAPGIEELGKLSGTLGRFVVRGNHDNRNYHGGRHAISADLMAALAEAQLPDLNNRGAWIERGGARLTDLWCRRPLD